MVNIKKVALVVSYAILAAVIILLYFRKDTQIVKVPSEKVINNRIEAEKQAINSYTTVISTDKAMIELFNSKIDSLSSEVAKAKAVKDTVRIIREQDTLIGTLFAQGQVKDSVIGNQDRVITIYKSTVANQDTLLKIKGVDLKRVKRQRNISLIVNGVLTTLLIIK
jgi:hypothetical protein